MNDVQRSLLVSSAADAGGECAGRAATIVSRVRVCVCVYVCVCVWCVVCVCVCWCVGAVKARYARQGKARRTVIEEEAEAGQEKKEDNN